MSCRELVEAITDYLEDTMSAEDRARFDAHLAICPFCVTYLEQMRRTIATVGELDEDSLAPPIRDELLVAFRGWQAAG